LSGNWESRGQKFTTYRLAIIEDGDQISGVVCSFYVGPILLFADVPVTGDRPDLWFTRGSTMFTGKYEEERDQIAGNFGDLPLRFTRAETGRCPTS
jgi:hypothetical protein